MKLDFYPAFQTNTIFNTYGLNQSIANKGADSTGAKEQEERRDLFLLSPQSGARSHLANLMKLKTELTDRKNELLKTVKDGGSIDSIKGQLDFYDEQIENIDQQIADAMAAEMDKKQEQEEEKRQAEEPVTREEDLNRRMNDITGLSDSISRIQVMDSARAAIDGRIKVLRSEIELDALNNDRPGASSYKKDQIAELEKRSKDLSQEIGTRLVQLAKDEAENSRPSEIIEEDELENIAEDELENIAEDELENLVEDKQENIAEKTGLPGEEEENES